MPDRGRVQTQLLDFLAATDSGQQFASVQLSDALLAKTRAVQNTHAQQLQNPEISATPACRRIQSLRAGAHSRYNQSRR
jgi:hypothetical protein